MASGASTVSVVRAGYWIFGRDSNRPVADIPAELFTHLYAGFAKVGDDGRLVIPDEYLDQFQIFTRTVRVRNPRVKTLLSIGGPGSDISQVVRDETRRAKFIEDSIDLARKFGFDGLDLCWLYPSEFDKGDDLIKLLKEWRNKLPKELLLTAAVFHHPAIPSPDGRSFNYPRDISKYLDWINVLAIDFYTPSNSPNETGPVHAWNTRDTDCHFEPTRCGSHGIGKWIDNNNGVPAKKLVLGLPFYGYEWNLINPNVYEYFARANPGDYKDYRTIQEIVNNDSTYQTWYDSDYVATYSHNKKGSWIGYDDETSITEKVKKAISDGLGGYVAWYLEGDDDNWTLSRAAFNAAINAVNT